MNSNEIPLTGSPSFYCITEQQLRDARRLSHQDPVSSPLIQLSLASLERTLNRNQQAALAFMLIERLLHTRK